MRRAATICVIFLLLGTMFAPLATASFVRSERLCCMRNAHHCSAMSGMPANGASEDPGDSIQNRSDCRCCALVGTIAPAQTRKPTVMVGPAEAHPFLKEFYSAMPDAPEARSNSDRGPPSD
jgi:hypothetical protein